MPPTPEQSEILALLGRIDQTPAGPEEFALTKQAVEMARLAEDEDLEYQARVRLTSSASHNGDTDTQLSSFAWCLAKHDSDPRRFPSGIGGPADLMWQYKWMPGALRRSTAFSLDQIEALLDDFEDHYRKAGLGVHAVIAKRFGQAWGTGQIERAKHWREILAATPRDSHSDCEACSLSAEAGFAAAWGQDDEMLRLIDEMVERDLRCVDQPAAALASALAPMLRAGRFEDAKAAHARSYALLRQSRGNLSAMADHLVFCSITGNLARALRLAERHLPSLAGNPLDESSRLDALAALGVVFESLERAGQGQRPVRGAERPEVAAALGLEAGPGGPAVRTASDLAGKAWAAAAALAAAFDARNGNSYISDKVAATRALLDQPYDLPLEAGSWAPPPPAPPAEPTDLPGLLDMAYSASGANLHQLQETYARRALELATLPPPDAAPPGSAEPPAAQAPGWAVGKTPAELRLVAHSALIAALAAQDREAEAEAALAERLAYTRSLGREAEAEVEALAGLALFRPGSPHAIRVALERAQTLDCPDAAISVLAGKLAHQLVHAADASSGAPGHPAPADPPGAAQSDPPASAPPGPPAAAPDNPQGGPWAEEIKRCLALALATAPAGSMAQLGALMTQAQLPWAGRAEVIDGIGRCLGMDIPAGMRAALLCWRAQRLADAGRLAEAAADADQATEIHTGLGFHRPAAAAAHQAGEVLWASGNPAEAATRFRYAIRAAELDGGYALAQRAALSGVLLEQGQTWPAIEAACDMLAFEEIDQAPPGHIADTRELLGRAYQQAGEPNQALRQWQRAAALWQQAEHAEGQARCYWRQGNLLRGHDCHEEAVECFDRAFGVLEGASWEALEALRPLAVAILEARALAKGRLGDATALDDLAQARRTALEDQAAWRAADLLDSRARVLLSLERPGEALPQFLEAADSYREAGDPLAGGAAELAAAQVAARHLDRPGDARVLAAGALGALQRLAWANAAGPGAPADAAQPGAPANAAGPGAPAADAAGPGAPTADAAAPSPAADGAEARDAADGAEIARLIAAAEALLAELA
ncbi:MAG: hypothetical protein LBD51_01745 [Bifidobacteriaceae bacterium]|jgi:tetratricopeptide (TPR) repeat protein|nr:hypothetical protein [Bifidobacteriaceae bacterium]